MAYQSPDYYRGVIKKAKKLIADAEIQMGHPDKSKNYMPVTFRDILLKCHGECCAYRNELEKCIRSLKTDSSKIKEYKQCLQEMIDCIFELEKTLLIR